MDISMKKNAKAMMALLMTASILSLAACGKKDETPDAGNTETEDTGSVMPEQYAAFVEELKQAAKDGSAIEGLDVSPAFDDAASIGYTMLDLDDDGSYELLLGELDAEKKIGTIYDIYTIKDGKMEHVVEAAENEKYFVLGNGQMVAESTDGEKNRVYAYYHCLDGVELAFIEAVIYDAADAENPWFHSSSATTSEGATEMTEEAAKTLLDRYAYVVLEFTTLGEEGK